MSTRDLLARLHPPASLEAGAADGLTVGSTWRAEWDYPGPAMAPMRLGETRRRAATRASRPIDLHGARQQEGTERAFAHGESPASLMLFLSQAYSWPRDASEGGRDQATGHRQLRGAGSRSGKHVLGTWGSRDGRIMDASPSYRTKEGRPR